MGEEGVQLEKGSESEVCGVQGSGVVVMDTPERRQITSPVSKFEDSPVFNYLNSLSPIKPVRSIHITQTFNSLTFSSPPSVFTSPHASSLRESRSLRRHHFLDPSKPEFSSENEKKVGRNEEATDMVHNSNEQQKFFDKDSLIGEASAEAPYESNLENELSQTFSYECVSPEHKQTSCRGLETDCIPDLTASSTELAPYAQTDLDKGSFGNEVHLREMSHIDVNNESSGCDWDSMFSDAPDLSLFDTPNDSKSLKDPNHGPFEPTVSFCTSLSDNMQSTVAAEASQQAGTDNNSSQREDCTDMKEITEDQDIIIPFNNVTGDSSDKANEENASNLHRGMRRRCLVFEMVGSRRKRLDDNSNCGPSMLSQSHDIASNVKSVVAMKPGNDTSKRILPGIGLHLNALAAMSLDHKVVKHEALAAGGQSISVSCSSSYLNSSNSQEILNSSLVVTSSERDVSPVEGGIQIAEDAALTSGYMVNDVFNHSSPKKKRRRMEDGGESEACKRCNCKKSKCLKLYCECFAAGVYCVEPCSCQDCFNKPIHEDTVLATRKQIESRNPLAFAPKVIRNSDSSIEIGEESSKTPASARHKRGCNCKKSGCLKKYCECYQGGVGCSINCRCEGCKNAFGRKDGTEVELDEDVDEHERSVADQSLQMNTIQNESEQNTNFAIPATPLLFGREKIQPCSSKSKRPPRSSFLSIGSSSGLFGNQMFGKLNSFPSQAKFEKVLQDVREDEMPEILQRNSSPISGVKSASPNSKRVSPPHCNNIRLSPGQRSSRKLILQSIPSFPSLTPKH